MSNYQPAAWPGDNDWAKLGGAADNVWDGRFNPSQFRPRPNRPTETVFIDQFGRRCRTICEARPRDRGNLRQISRLLIGKHITEARRIYPNIRVVIRDGVDLPTTLDYRPERINVETRNGIIIRILGFY